jgi:hypothetical protein
MNCTYQGRSYQGRFASIVGMLCLVLGLFPACFGQTSPITQPISDWAIRAGGAGYDIAKSIAADRSGHAYIAGFFFQPTEFGTFRLTNSGSSDAYIAKLDSQGHVLWATKPTGSAGDFAGRIDVSPHGDVYVTGSSASSRLTFGDVTFTNHPGGGSFLARMNSNGQFIWGLRTARYSGFALSSFPDVVSVDGEGSCVVAGQFDGRMTLGSRPLTNRAVDVYLAKVRSDATVD